MATSSEALTCVCVDAGCSSCRYDISFALPASAGVGVLAVAASSSLKLEDRARVVSGSGAPAPIANGGPGTAELGVEAKSGSIISKGPVVLRDRSRVDGSITTSASLTRSNGVTVTGPIATQEPIAFSDALRLSVSVPKTSGPGIDVQPGQQRSLSPGRYAAVSVKSRATLSLTAGTYSFDSLAIEPQATLSLNESGGPIFIYVLGTLGALRGTFAHVGGSAADLLLGYLGSLPVFVESPFSGTLVAPSASVTVASVGAAGHVGAFFAATLNLRPDVLIRHAPFRSLAAPLQSLRALDRLLTTDELAAEAAHYESRDLDATALVTPTSDVIARANEARARRDAALATAAQHRADIDALVARAALELAPTSSPSLVTSSLIAFLARVHRNSAVSLRPAFDDTCRDIVADQFLFDVADALVAGDRARYALALGSIEEALQCQSANFALRTNDALVAAHAEAVLLFPSGARAAVARTLDELVLNTFLLVHDETKMNGATALFQWFQQRRAALGLVLARSNSVPRWSGLWVRDPDGSRLVSIRQFCEAPNAGPNCVSSTHLLDAISDPFRLGLGACSIAEMVGGPLDTRFGYDCDRGLCGENPPAGSPFKAPFSPPGLTRLFGNGGQSQFGVSIASLQSRLCDVARRRSSGNGSGGAGVPGSFFQCVTQNLVSPAQKATACFIDALRSSSITPFQSITGWPSDVCGPSADGNTPADPPKPPPPSVDEAGKKNLEDTKKALEEKYKKEEERNKVKAASGNTVTNADIDKAVAEAKAAQYKDKTAGSGGETRYDTGTDKNAIAVNDDLQHLPESLKAALDHELLHAALNHSDKGRSTEKEQHDIICGKLGRTGCLCDESSLNCGDCSPARAASKAFTNCLAPALPQTPSAHPLDRLIYPTQDSTNSIWSECFRIIDAGLDPVPPLCTQITCPAGQVAKPSADGKACPCSSPSSGLLPPRLNGCFAIRCPDGSSGPVVGPDGSCLCATPGQAALPPAGIIIP